MACQAVGALGHLEGVARGAGGMVHPVVYHLYFAYPATELVGLQHLVVIALGEGRSDGNGCHDVLDEARIAPDAD